MHNGWLKTTLGELCLRGEAMIQTGPFGSQLHSYEYQTSGVPVVPTEAIGRRRIRDDAVPRVSEAVVSRLARHKLRAGDILFARRGARATGLSALVEPKHEGWLCGTGAILLRLEKADVDPTFLSFLLSSDIAVSWLKAHAVGAVMPNLNESILRLLPLFLPPLNEQQTIARVLDNLDDKIDLNRRMNETLETIARTLFRSWFYKAKFKDSWKMQRLSDFLTLDKGISYKGQFLINSGVPMVNLGCFKGQGHFDAAAIKLYADEYQLRQVIQSGDLVIANTDITQKREVIGSPAIVPRIADADELIFSHHVFAARFSPVQTFWKFFVYYLLLQDDFRERAVGFATGTTVLALPRDAVLNLEFHAPPKKLVEAFNKRINPIVQIQWLNNEESRTLAAIRDVLLPKLLSGEIRLKPQV